MRHPMIADRDRSMLLVVDVQEAMLKAISIWEETVRRVSQLVRAAMVLEIPILVTEHYKKGLGATISQLDPVLKQASFFQKEHFSACLEEDFLQTVRSFHRPQIILTGMESHVCVFQTGMDLIQSGYQVHLVRNAVASRFKEDWITAVNLFRDAGAVISSAEMVIFQWVRRSNTDEFRAVLPIVK